MESRIIVRVSDQDAIHLKCIADELGLNVSEFVRAKVLGKNLNELYLNLINRNIQELELGQPFTLKKLLIIKNNSEFTNTLKVSHFDYLSRIEKDSLIQLVVEQIDEDEISAEYTISKNGKYKFRKIEMYDYLENGWDD
jgi:hypothetical protein